MVGKISLTAAAASMLIAGAYAQCPNSGVGIGREQLCNFSGHNTICGETWGFITAPGTWNQVAVKHNLDGTNGQSCGGYDGLKGFGPAHVDCDGSTITGATPPNAGHYQCSSANIVKGGGFGSFAVIAACCQPA
ncbi:hypothetical protein N7471_004706 [Penicillium samsonianum]|uniref:uncharacterized protein n=1 Tax=Penicillium samsonianum TaxID=1882272 RepID=UPI00254720E3|nr:uncharacterized protein N7471_004706 [Penicillium samsonianum]KAJ6138220.1 hypothetical protein N7471_004706 [Penicillium samsonianum]